MIAGCNNSRIPDDGSVTSIGDFAFCECSFLKNITIPGSVTKIGYKSFYGCSFKSVTMQNGVKKIGSCAFEGCSSLKSMTIPKSVKKIGLSAFDGEEELNYAGSSNEFERIRFKLSFSIGVTVRCNDGVWEFKKEYKPTISEKLKDEQHVAARRIFNTFCVLSGMIGVILFVLLIVDPWEDYTFGGVAANTTLSLGSIFLCMSAGVLISGNILIDGTYWQRFISSLAGISLCGTLIAGIFYVVGNNDTAIAAGQALPWLSLPLGSLPLLCYFEINKNILADKHFVLKLFAGLIGLLIAAGMIWGFSSAIFFIKTISLW